MGFAFPTETGAVSRRRAKTLESYRFSIRISNNFHLNRTFPQKYKEICKPHDFHNFTPKLTKKPTESSDFFDSIGLGPQNQGSLQTRHVFKAQMVTHFVIPILFRWGLKIYSKNMFYGISAVGVEFMIFM